LSRLETSFVLGYHGCERALAFELVTGDTLLEPSNKPYDWVGPGVYFWQSDPQRAWEWAEQRHRDEKISQPGVVGAVIDLGNCLDLLTRENQDLLSWAYDAMKGAYTAAGKKLPANRNSSHGGDKDRLLRELDCAVIRYLHAAMDAEAVPDADGYQLSGPLPFFDSVRGMFTEGDQIYPDASFYTKSHVQIAVRNPESIKGLFLPPELIDRMR
jgi:hypothetical protein